MLHLFFVNLLLFFTFELLPFQNDEDDDVYNQDNYQDAETGNDQCLACAYFAIK